ncbi:hypothetical protein CPter291_4049 [Collimonas pratensis]|uniref:Uncharacterized protein n=1 Tax=Collimonas pratensis TaxID=279113 RepID=A0ABM5ZAU2_9BURK|nr:hypothetical protein CPter291_4049 [Collimonas pratensis]
MVLPWLLNTRKMTAASDASRHLPSGKALNFDGNHTCPFLQ